MQFETLFQLYCTTKAYRHCFLVFLLSLFCTISFPSHWQLSNITITDTMIGCERVMNPVTMPTIFRKKLAGLTNMKVCNKCIYSIYHNSDISVPIHDLVSMHSDLPILNMAISLAFHCEVIILSHSLARFKDQVNLFPNKSWFLHVCNTSLLKTLWKRKNCS